MDWGHLSLDADLPDYKGGWRGALPVVEIVALTDRDAERLVRPRPRRASFRLWSGWNAEVRGR